MSTTSWTIKIGSPEQTTDSVIIDVADPKGPIVQKNKVDDPVALSVDGMLICPWDTLRYAVVTSADIVPQGPEPPQK
jgi:hypothetical protein